MKHLIALAALAASVSFAAHAQTPTTPAEPVQYMSLPAANPLVLVNKHQTAMGAFVLNPDKIKSVDMFKGAKAIRKFGDKAKEGAIVMVLKENVAVSNLSDLYAHFNIPEEQQQYKLSINNSYVANPDLLLVDLSAIEKVEVVTKQNIFTNSDDTYLNIVTQGAI